MNGGQRDKEINGVRGKRRIGMSNRDENVRLVLGNVEDRLENVRNMFHLVLYILRLRTKIIT